MNLRAKARWLSQISGVIFLIIHAHMRGKFIFESGNTAGKLLLISMIAALLTLVFGIMSLPRWQGFVALAISAYAAYWFAVGPLYAIS
jgi:hypothetical protein